MARPSRRGPRKELVTTSEEPVDMAAVDEAANDLPGVMRHVAQGD